jgi:dipeptidyl aminopeptidase/acylaminoacyl peptidase
MESGYGQWGTRVQDDLIDGMRWAAAQGYADAKRVCVYGASFGGYSAMMTAARAPDLVKCVVSLSGLYDLDAFARKSDVKTSAYGRSYIERTIGRDKAARLAQSPISLASRIKAPVFMAHGEIDKRTPFAQAVAMKEALEEAGNAPEWMPVPKEGHGFYERSNDIEFYRRLEAFLEGHIGAAAE